MATLRTTQHIDPVRRILAHLVNDKGSGVGNTNIAEDLISSSPHTVIYPRVYSETLKSWNKIDDNCKAITIAKQRFGSGKSAMDQTVEFAVEFICWTNRGVNEHELWDLWAKVDTMFHDQHDYEVGNKTVSGSNEVDPMKVLHSYRFQEPSFELRFGSTSGSAVARLSSAQKLRLASLSSIYNFVGWEYQISTVPT